MLFHHKESITDRYDRFDDMSRIHLGGVEIDPGLRLYAGTQFPGLINQYSDLWFSFLLAADGVRWPQAGLPPDYDETCVSEDQKRIAANIAVRYPIGPELVWLAGDERRFVARLQSQKEDYWRQLSMEDATEMLAFDRIETRVGGKIILLDYSHVEALRDALWRVSHNDKRVRGPYDDDDFGENDDIPDPVPGPADSRLATT